MRYRVRKPRFAPLRNATAPLCTLLNIALHNAAFCCIFENCPTPRLSTSFKKIAVSFFMPGIVDSARFTPRGALRLNHLFRCWTLRYACKHARSRSYTNPPLSHQKKKASKFRCFLFLCEREWMKNRCKATVRTAQQQRRRCVLSLSLCYTMQRFAVYLITVQRRGYPPLPHIRVDSEPPVSVLDASL